MVICQERLAINDLSECGKQPFMGSNGEFVYASNGETYNYPEIRQKYGKEYNFIGFSDGEGMGCLYQHYNGDVKFLEEMEGMWGLIFYNIKNNTFLIARDHIGIIPIYYGQGSNGEKYISSELKAIHDQCEWVEILLPGHYLTDSFKQIQWYFPRWHDLSYIPTGNFDLMELRTTLTKAVKEQLLGDVPFGLLISGGVDSSIIASIIMKMVKSGEIDIKKRGMTEVPSFCVGLKGSPDMEFAKKVADFIGTTHYEIHFTVEEGIDALEEVIYHTETFNATTVRASTPMFLMARRIKNYGIKMVMTGEGADEIFGGYLYFHKAPNKEEFHKELIRKMQDLYKYDLLRANKSCLAWGVEVRPPFMHKAFIEYAMNIPPEFKMPKNNPMNIEKYILRFRIF